MGSKPVTPTEIHQALTPLVGLRWRTIGRAADLLWLSFGEAREVACPSGKSRIVEEWALHVQCPWLLMLPDGRKLTDEDYGVDIEGNVVPNGRGYPGRSRFDFIADQMRKEFDSHSPKVAEFERRSNNGFVLRSSDGHSLTVSPDNRGESWRLFVPATDGPHFVV